MIPEIGSRERNEREERALKRGRELLAEHEGRIRVALDVLHDQLYGELLDDVKALRLSINDEYKYAREYARELVSHVEGCWATSVLR